MTAYLWQILQIFLCVAAAPLFTGYVRCLKARLLGKRAPSIIQPYRDLYRLLQKESIVADSTSWIFRTAPYIIFTSIWLAACIVPIFTTDMLLIPAADLIALVMLLGLGRFFTALAGMDAGTAFGGLGASREMMFASLAEPAMLLMIFSLSLVAGTTAPAHIIDFVLSGKVGVEVSLGLAMVSIMMVAIAENGRIPVDNPATHLELTMVHEAMTLEYSGRHLALIEAAGMVRLLLFVSLIAGLFLPWGIAAPDNSIGTTLSGVVVWAGKAALLGTLLAVFETSIAKMRVFRVADFMGGALLLALLATIFLYVSRSV